MVADQLVQTIGSLFSHGNPVPLHEPVFLGNEENYVLDCIQSGWVSSVGSYVDRFEQSLAQYVGASYAVSAVNGTSALHLALETVGVESDDEVLMPSMTFIATANAVSYCKAIPHFIDIEDQTFGIDANKLKDYLKDTVVFNGEYAYNKYTKRKISAIIIVHCFGMPARDIEQVYAIAKHYNMALIEDSAESLGSFYDHRHTGTLSDIGVFSFNGNKIITTGGGGMLVTNNHDYAKKAKHLATTGKVHNEYHQTHDCVAYNYRLPNINAALGVAQLEQIDSFIDKKRQLAKQYQALLNTEHSTVLQELQGMRSNYWLNTMVIQDTSTAKAVFKQSNANNIMTRMVWQPLHQSLPYANQSIKMELDMTEFYSDRLINLPSGAGL